jgi:hypothetical protein
MSPEVPLTIGIVGNFFGTDYGLMSYLRMVLSEDSNVISYF